MKRNVFLAGFVALVLATLLFVIPAQGHHRPWHTGGPPVPTPTETEPPPPPPPTCADADVTLTPAPGELEAATLTARAEHKLNRSVCVVLQTGATYREQFILPFESGLTAAPITLDLNGATISGADVFALSPAGDGLLSAVWPHNLGDIADPWPTLNYDRVLLNREALFIDGTPYVVVNDPAELADGTFIVDEAADLITIDPYPQHESATTAEITVRPLNRSPLNAFGRGLVYFDGRGTVTVRNGTIQRANGAVQESAAGGVNGGTTSNWTFENLTLRENASGGLGICCTNNITWRNVDAVDNGIQTLGLHNLRDVLIEDSDLTGNNWRGAWPTPGFPQGFRGWAAGTKFGAISNMTVRRWTAVKNAHHGFWLDWDNDNILVEDLVSAGNGARGVFTESNDGPITYRRALVCNNAIAGFSHARSNGITVEDSAVFDNVGAQHLFTGNVTPIDIGGGRVIRGDDFTLRNSIASTVDNAAVPGQFHNANTLIYGGNRVGDPSFDSTAVFSGNTWWHGARLDAFYLEGFTTFSGYLAKYPQASGETWAASNPAPTCPAPRPPAVFGLPGDW
jgi:hypothetical protein